MTEPLRSTGHAGLFVEQVADEATLREAWWRVQRGGRAAGVDHMTIDEFKHGADARLRQLSRSLIGGTYQPSPVRRLLFPKPSGGVRAIAVPTVVDRIAATAAAVVLHDRVAGLFSGRSFAYRPFLGPRRAAIFLRSQLPSATWVVTADISKFFDNVEHRILADQLRNAGIDGEGIRLIGRWLLAPVQDGPRRYQPLKGLPQGSPVSPMLANLYLTGFDMMLEAEGFVHVRYADDFVVVTKDEPEARRALQYVTTYLRSKLRLDIKPAKTQLATVSQGFDFVGFRFTKDAWTAPAESLNRFRQTLADILTTPSDKPLSEVAKSHNDLVHGWRNYYAGNSTELDQQLAELDGWRHGEALAFLERRGESPNAAVWFASLVSSDADVAPPGTYASEPEHDVAGDLEQRQFSGIGDAAWHRDARVFSTERERHDAEIGRRQLPVMFDDGWLRVPTFGAFVSKSQALMVVRRKKQVIFECPLDDLECISIESEGVALSTTAIEECVRRQIPIAICRSSGRPVARLLPAHSRRMPGLLRRQVVARTGRSGFALVREILDAKLANQRALLLYHSKYRRRDPAARRKLLEAAVRIRDCRSELDRIAAGSLRQTRRAFFLAEARAAAHYWSGFAVLLPEGLGFRGRRHRDAADVVNKALNYGYGFLLNQLWLSVHRAGLEASLGLLHTGRRRTPGLIFDLMEPYRQPVIDRTVLGLIGRGARLILNEQGQLSLRTRGLLQRAFVKRLTAGAAGRETTLLRRVQREGLAMRRAIRHRRPYRAYRMSW